MIDSVLQALVEPRRRAILHLLQAGEQPVGVLAAQLAITQPAVSQHLRVLASAGLVTARAQGTRHLYRLRPEGLAELRAYLDSFWEDRLTHLRQAAEAAARSDQPDADPPAKPA